MIRVSSQIGFGCGNGIDRYPSGSGRVKGEEKTGRGNKFISTNNHVVSAKKLKNRKLGSAV